MFWNSLMFSMTLCLVISDAADNEQDLERQSIGSRGYSFHTWKKDIWNLYRQDNTSKKTKYIWAITNKLNRMIQFEASPQFGRIIRAKDRIKGSKRLDKYLAVWSKIIDETTLVRKPKTISNNLFDITSRHNGCTEQDLSRMNRLGRLFDPGSHIYIIFQTLKDETLTFCLLSYRNLMKLTNQLMSKEDYDIVVKLSELANWTGLDDPSLAINKPESVSIETLQKAIGSYLSGLDHPALDNIASMSPTQIQSTVEDIFKNEVYRPVSTLCLLLNPIRENISMLSYHLGPHIPVPNNHYIRLTYFSCSIASLVHSSNVPIEIRLPSIEAIDTTVINNETERESEDIMRKRVRNREDIVGKDYTFDTWRMDLQSLFGVIWSKKPVIKDALSKLERVKLFEQSPRFQLAFEDELVFNRSGRVRHYFLSAYNVTMETTLLRKTKSVSHNMIEIISNHNGCGLDEITKIDNLAKLFRQNSRVNKILSNAKHGTLHYCRDFFIAFMDKMHNLIGLIDLEAVYKLNQCISMAQYEDRVYLNAQHDESRAPSDSVSKGLASYLNSLNHPQLDDIDSKDFNQIESIVAEMFETEILYPVSVFCLTLNPIKQYLNQLNPTVAASVNDYDALIDMSCNLATSSIRSATMQEFLKIRLNLS